MLRWLIYTVRVALYLLSFRQFETLIKGLLELLLYLDSSAVFLYDGLQIARMNGVLTSVVTHLLIVPF